VEVEAAGIEMREGVRWESVEELQAWSLEQEVQWSAMLAEHQSHVGEVVMRLLLVAPLLLHRRRSRQALQGPVPSVEEAGERDELLLLASFLAY
jgi:hypothetical protein